MTLTCSSCEINKAQTAFTKERRSKTGFRSQCKSCRKVYDHAHRPAISASSKSYRLKNKRRIADVQRKWRELNKDKIMKRAVLYGASHRDELNMKAYLRYHGNPEVLERSRERRRINPISFRAADKRWRQNNILKARAMKIATNHRREARQLANGGSFTFKEWLDLKSLYDYRCLACGKQEPDIVLSADHVQPVSMCGINDITNIQPLCISCNSHKGTRVIDYRSSYQYKNVGLVLDKILEGNVESQCGKGREGGSAGTSAALRVESPSICVA